MAAKSTFQCSVCSFLSDDITLFVNHGCSSGDHTTATVPSVLVSPNDLTLDQQALASLDMGTAKPALEKWEDHFVRLLVTSYMHYKDLFGKGKTTKKEVFDKIASRFNATSDVFVTGEQCLRKWIKLEANYKEIDDHNKLTGRERKTWKFLDEMEVCIGGSRKVRPAFTYDVAEGSSSSSTSTAGQQNDTSSVTTSDDDGGDFPEVTRPKRKRKSQSSAAELITFLKSYSDKRERAEEEKLNVLKTMQEEKKECFTQFLDVLKNK